ncbi:DUF624 domain-containing protein [Enterococcus casseliflavus]|uniref:DUF624 domain-containing protein n=1 Tax=Enterococcus casseliflavus TaxID=37734 RepID=UPI001330EAF8|nr:DUF624 domain-containing protein [Enterococcus casseliflavus]
MKKNVRQSEINQKDSYKLFHHLSYLNYIIYTFLGTLLFWLFNVPLLFLLLTMEIKLSTLPLFLLSFLPVAPAFTALLIYLKEAKEKDGTPKVFLLAYRRKFKHSLLGWLPVLVVIGLCSANLLLLRVTIQITELKWLNLFLLIVALTFAINYFLVVATAPSLSIKEALLLNLQLFILKSSRYMLSFMIIISSWLLLALVPIYLALFGVGLIGILLLLNFTPVMEFARKHSVR